MFKIVHMMGCMSCPESSLPASDTLVLLASGEGLRYCALSDMTFFFFTLLRWSTSSGTGSGNKATILCNKVGCRVSVSNLRGHLIYIFSHKAVRCFSDVWHCNEVLILLTRPPIKVIVLTLEREWGYFIWCSVKICFCYDKGGKKTPHMAQV